MEPLHDNSNCLNRDQARPGDVGDRQLDELLSLATVPKIGRRRKRRLQKYLASVLGANRPSLKLGSDLTRGVVGAAAACGLFFCIFLLGQMGQRQNEIPAVAGRVSTEIAPPEVANVELRRQIITHVVWSPMEHRRPQRLAGLLNDRFVRLRQLLNDFADSDLGLGCLEHVGEAIDLERKRASRSRNRDLRKNALAIQKMRERYESVLVQIVESARSTSEQKTLAFRKLCRIGSQRTKSFVMKHWGNDQLASDIMISARRLANASSLAQLAVATNNSDLKTELMIELLERGDDENVQIFLQLTERHQLFAEARQSGQLARRLPTAKLLSALQSNRLSVVRAASITLSQVDDPEITRRLFELADRAETRHAAVLALTARQDELATRFVEFAEKDLRWSATVAMAQRKWNRLLAIN